MGDKLYTVKSSYSNLVVLHPVTCASGSQMQTTCLKTTRGAFQYMDSYVPSAYSKLNF